VRLYFVYALSFINGTAVQAARVVLPLQALDLHASALTVGLLGATFSVLPLALSVPAGRLADRFGSRWLLMLSALGGALSMPLPYFSPGMATVFIASAIIGLAFGIYNVSLQNAVGQLSKSETRARDFSNYSLSNSAGAFVGPLVAGFSIEHHGFPAAYIAITVLTLIPSAMLAARGDLLPPGERQGAGERPAQRAEGGVLSLLAEPGVKRALSASGLLLTGQDLYRVYMPVYTHAIGLGASTIGIVLASFPAAAFFVRLILQRLIARFGEQKVLVTSFYITAICLSLIPLFENAAMLVLVSFLFGLGMGCGQPIITMLMFANSPKGRSGEAMGLRMTVIHFTRLVGPVAFGAIGSALGLASMFWINASMMGAGGWLSRSGLPTRRP
jgi:MFS family permease